VLKYQAPGVKWAEVPEEIKFAKVPEANMAMGLIQEVTSVAVTAELVSNVTPPVKPILPVIGTSANIVSVDNSTAAMSINDLSVFMLGLVF
jgi:hypothetical protein